MKINTGSERRAMKRTIPVVVLAIAITTNIALAVMSPPTETTDQPYHYPEINTYPTPALRIEYVYAATVTESPKQFVNQELSDAPDITKQPEPTETVIQSEDNPVNSEALCQVDTKAPCSERELDMLAKTVWGEARGCSPDEQRLVVWTVFQRVDDGEWGDTIEDVITNPGQFTGYDEQNPIDPDIYTLCSEEAKKWRQGEPAPLFAPYATIRPYLYFDGDGTSNWFRKDYQR